MKAFFAIMLLTLGVMMFAAGYRAKQSGQILPATTQRGPMTGTHAMFAGVVCFTFGAAWTWIAVRHKK
jgi:hypothetical protein